MISGNLLVQGRADCQAAALQNMGVDHGGFNILMTEQFLDSADIVAVLEQMGSEGVAKGVRGDGFVNFYELSGLANCLLQNCLIQMMTANNS